MTQKIRLLVVGLANVVHTQRWLDLLVDQTQNFDVRVYDAPVSFADLYPPRPWRFPTYSLYQPRQVVSDQPVHWLIPRLPGMPAVVRRLGGRAGLNARWLHWILRRWRPHIVHSLSVEVGADYTWPGLRGLPPAVRPHWMISSWGTEINWGVHDPAKRSKLQTYLQACDSFLGDCTRDLELVRQLGMADAKIHPARVVPAAGGLDLEVIAPGPLPPAERKTLLIPKAYEAFANKTVTLLEGLAQCAALLAPYTVHLLRVSDEVRAAVARLPEAVRTRCVLHAEVDHAQVLKLMQESRVMLAPSLSDGAPMSLLEAMATGALPLVSPIDSVEEWVSDGVNGVLAHALYPDQIAQALTRALTDDALVNGAAVHNRRLVETRANRAHIRPAVLDAYRRLAG